MFYIALLMSVKLLSLQPAASTNACFVLQSCTLPLVSLVWNFNPIFINPVTKGGGGRGENLPLKNFKSSMTWHIFTHLSPWIYFALPRKPSLPLPLQYRVWLRAWLKLTLDKEALFLASQRTKEKITLRNLEWYLFCVVAERLTQISLHLLQIIRKQNL